MKLSHIAADLQIVYRSFVRNPLALFFSLLFPIILIGLFGLIFSTIGSSTTSLYVVNEDHGSNVSEEFLTALDNTSVVSVQVVNVSTSDFAAWLGQNDYAAGLVIPAGFANNYSHDLPVNVTVFVNPQDASIAGSVLGAVQGVENGFNLQAACGPPGNCTAVLGLEQEKVGSQVYTYIDYLIPGLIGFSILTSPMFSLVNATSEYRREGIFRQLSLTPLTRAEWLTSRAVWYVLLSFASAGIVIGAGAYLFGAHVALTWQLLPFLVVGPFFFVSLGMLVGSVSKTPEAAGTVGNVITFPMMFLSGTFFTVSSFPSGLQTVAHLLPLYYVIDGMNQVMLFQNYARALTDLVVVLAASVVVFLAAVRAFRWRDE